MSVLRALKVIWVLKEMSAHKATKGHKVKLVPKVI
jgi:hypothetical protein